MKFAICNEDADETPLPELLASVTDTDPTALKRGTKDMLQRGQCRYILWRTCLARRPRLNFPSFAACLFAVNDVADELPATDCYVIVGGRAIIGDCAVWRYPCHSVADVEVIHPKSPHGGRELDG